MQFRIAIVVLLTILLSTIPVFGQQPNQVKLLEFAKVIGLYEQINQQKTAIEEQGSKVANQYSQQLFASLGEIPPELQTIFEKEFENYMKNLSNLIDTDFAVNAYLELISKKLTENEIENIISFYQSPTGKKYTQSNIAITPEWTKLFMADVDSKLMTQLQQFLKNLQNAISSYSQQQN